MKRSTVYPLAGALSLLIGAGIGVAGRNCSHPGQPPFFECAIEDPPDVLLPALAPALLAIAIVAAVDVAYVSVKKRPDSQVPRWRRSLYLGLLVVVGFPAARIAVEQAAGGYADGDPFLIFVIGAWALTPVVLVEFIVWLLRRFNGARLLTPPAILIAIGGVTYAITGDPELACVRHSADNISCHQGMQMYIATYVLLWVMTGMSFLPNRQVQQTIPSDDDAESIRR